MVCFLFHIIQPFKYLWLLCPCKHGLDGIFIKIIKMAQAGYEVDLEIILSEKKDRIWACIGIITAKMGILQ